MRCQNPIKHDQGRSRSPYSEFFCLVIIIVIIITRRASWHQQTVSAPSEPLLAPESTLQVLPLTHLHGSGFSSGEPPGRQYPRLPPLTSFTSRKFRRCTREGLLNSLECRESAPELRFQPNQSYCTVCTPVPGHIQSYVLLFHGPLRLPSLQLKPAMCAAMADRRQTAFNSRHQKKVSRLDHYHI